MIMTHGRNGPSPSRNPNTVNGNHAFITAVVEQGAAVINVARRGYGNSDGPDSEYLDTPEASALAGAKDLAAIVAYAREQPFVDDSKLLIAGQSQGGWIAVAASTLDMPGVIGAINFSGAINFRQANGPITGPGVEWPIEKSATLFGKASKMPMLWVYASNDNHSTFIVSDWFRAYTSAGGKGKLVFTPNYFGSTGNGHTVISKKTYYFSEMLAWMKEVGFLPKQKGDSPQTHADRGATPATAP